MRGLFVGTVGAIVLVAAAAGLSLDAFRAGPYDRPLDPVTFLVPYEATFSTSSTAGPLGLCPMPPCPATTEVDARFEGLPPVPYNIRLEGSGGAVGLGTYEPVDGVVDIQWRGEDDVDRIVLAVAGRDVGSIPLFGLAALVLSWGAEPGSIHVNEIGGVTIAGVAMTRLTEQPPPGWEFRARFEGPGGSSELGALDQDDDGAILDGRVERLRLEDNEHVTILVAPVDSEPAVGFPILRADLWP